MTETVAAIGTGIIGCLVARALLAVRPECALILLDRDMTGLGASQRSAGVRFPVGATPRVREMAAFSEHYYRELETERADPCLHPLDLHAICPVDKVAEVRTRFISPGPLRRGFDEPSAPVGPLEGVSAWSVPGGCCTDVGRLVARLARDLRGRAEIREGACVTGVAERRDGVELAFASGESLAVDRVVLAPGPWANAPAWRALTAPLGIRVKKIAAFHFDFAMPARATAVLFPNEDAFLVPLRHRGHWLYSFTCGDWDIDPDGVPLQLSEANLADARATLAPYAPDLVPSIHSGRVFCDAYSPAREPVVARIGETGRIVFAGAANGSGYRLGPAIAAAAAELAAAP